MFPIVANLYTEEVKSRALASLEGTAPNHWFRHVDDKIKTQELQAFPEHIRSMELEYTGDAHRPILSLKLSLSTGTRAGLG